MKFKKILALSLTSIIVLSSNILTANANEIEKDSYTTTIISIAKLEDIESLNTLRLNNVLISGTTTWLRNVDAGGDRFYRFYYANNTTPTATVRYGTTGNTAQRTFTVPANSAVERRGTYATTDIRTMTVTVDNNGSQQLNGAISSRTGSNPL